MKSFLALLVPALIFSLFFALKPTTAEARDIVIPLKIERYTSTMGEVNVRRYLKNVEDYHGLRLAAIEVEAAALNESAATTLLVNEIQQGQALSLEQVPLKFLIVLDTDFFMGQGAEEIKLLTQNPAYIKNVNLILTR